MPKWKAAMPFIAIVLCLLQGASIALAQEKKPNILVIFGDDIGQSNISAYSRGLMGFTTPNIDRIGAAGGVFVNYYGQQSCTAGRGLYHGIMPVPHRPDQSRHARRAGWTSKRGPDHR